MHKFREFNNEKNVAKSKFVQVANSLRQMIKSDNMVYLAP